MSHKYEVVARLGTMLLATTKGLVLLTRIVDPVDSQQNTIDECVCVSCNAFDIEPCHSLSKTVDNSKLGAT